MRTHVLVVLMTLASLRSGSPASAAGKPRGTVCWPLNFAGITVDVNTDSQVQRLVGKGVFRQDEGHTGGRYFIDASHTATLHIVEGVDQVVEELTVTEGVSHEIKTSEQANATSKWFDPHEPFGNYHALHLGSTKEQVLSNLGQPQKRVNPNEWRYESTCACEIPSYLTVSFKAGRLIQLELSAEE